VKKLLLTVLIGCALLSMAPMAVHATRPKEVSGEIEYMAHFKVYDGSGECVLPDAPGATSNLCIKMADGNTFAETFEEAAYTGGMAGDSTNDCKVVIHSSGAWSYKAISSFNGTVDGKTGTLQIQMVGKKPVGEEWYGQWVILGGTGELATLRGQGTWFGPGAPGAEKWGDVSYEGQIHFKPH